MAVKNAAMVQPWRITLRDFCRDDIEPTLDYWYRSPPGYIEALGFDRSQMRSESEMAQNLEHLCAGGVVGEMPWLTVELDGVAIGVHLINQIDRNRGTASFHAHYWHSAARGRGVFRASFPRSCVMFLDRFRLQRIIVVAPIHNPASIRSMANIGLQPDYRDRMHLRFCERAVDVLVFHVTREKCLHLLEEVRT